MTDPERREQIEQLTESILELWYPDEQLGTYDKSSVTIADRAQATLTAGYILQREAAWQREIVKPLEHGLDLRAEVIANHVAEIKRLLKVAEAAKAYWPIAEDAIFQGEYHPLDPEYYAARKELLTTLDALEKGETP